MTGPKPGALRTVGARHRWDGRPGEPGRARIPSLRDFRKVVLALAAALRQPRKQAPFEPG